MDKKVLLIGFIWGSLLLAGCTNKHPNPREVWIPPIDASIGIPLPPPPEGGNMRWPDFDKMIKRQIDEVCFSGIMQTGSDFFQELTKNASTKMEKLLFIKAKLESIQSNASEESKKQIIQQLKVINEIIEEVGERDAEVKQDPNVICRKTDEMKQMNKNMRERILGLSWDMKIIREHEKNEWILQHMKEKIFWEDAREDFSDSKEQNREQEWKDQED